MDKHGEKDYSEEPWKDIEHRIEVRLGYEGLSKVLLDALNQAQWGKGAARHNGSGKTPFEDQIVMTITSLLGLGFPLGQATKKILESQRGGLNPVGQRAELYGAIIYIAAAIMKIEETGYEQFDPTP